MATFLRDLRGIEYDNAWDYAESLIPQNDSRDLVPFIFIVDHQPVARGGDMGGYRVIYVTVDRRVQIK